jgi:hypothetical protein
MHLLSWFLVGLIGCSAVAARSRLGCRPGSARPACSFPGLVCPPARVSVAVCLSAALRCAALSALLVALALGPSGETCGIADYTSAVCEREKLAHGLLARAFVDAGRAARRRPLRSGTRSAKKDLSPAVSHALVQVPSFGTCGWLVGTSRVAANSSATSSLAASPPSCSPPSIPSPPQPRSATPLETAAQEPAITTPGSAPSASSPLAAFTPSRTELVLRSIWSDPSAVASHSPHSPLIGHVPAASQLLLTLRGALASIALRSPQSPASPGQYFAGQQSSLQPAQAGLARTTNSLMLASDGSPV